ncbi:MAG: hypothetical protein A3G81_05070 [Betaproteobacteria bacterium RIFCSPLOWO2_12_FULL_65_14]|nr:MAG: hypothetical protein A3G81_05070 [Betaproteobacteria bacterium RIFCSPLOWO2_12_FULL_65_14]
MASFVLIDYENVQPKNIGRLNGGRYKVKVFTGAKQKVTVDMANALQALGPDVQYVQIAGEGKNAVDFHIAYYIGKLAAETPKATFHVISADTGFDPLVKHLASQEISCQRWKSIADIPPTDPSKSASSKDRRELVVDYLKKLKNNKPGTEKRLRNTINARFENQLTDEDLDALVLGLMKLGIIKVAGGKVQYLLPA